MLPEAAEIAGQVAADAVVAADVVRGKAAVAVTQAAALLRVARVAAIASRTWQQSRERVALRRDPFPLRCVRVRQ